MIQKMNGAVASTADNVIPATDFTELHGGLQVATRARNGRPDSIKIGYVHLDGNRQHTQRTPLSFMEKKLRRTAIFPDG